MAELALNGGKKSNQNSLLNRHSPNFTAPNTALP